MSLTPSSLLFRDVCNNDVELSQQACLLTRPRESLQWFAVMETIVTRSPGDICQNGRRRLRYRDFITDP